MAGQTLTDKILRSHLVQGEYRSGNLIKIRIDQTLCQDATGTMAFLELEAMKIGRVKTELSVVYIDHNTAQFGPENQNDQHYLQSVAAAKGAWYSRAGNGICHQVHLERFGIPGKTLLGSDSHTPTNGGLGMISIGAGGLDVALAMGGLPFSLRVPKVIGVCLSGRLNPWVAAKDVILHLLSILTTKGNVDTSIEYWGSGVATLSVPERATITNMGAELGVTFSIFPSDRQTASFLKAQNRAHDWSPLVADNDALYEQNIDVDLSALEPLAACPSSPDNVKPVRELSDISVEQVVIGSCTNGSLKDLTMVATILKKHPAHPRVSLGIAPGSRQVLETLAANGGIEAIIQGGGRILETVCGPCIGQGFSPGTDAVSVRTFNRNFAGRTGTPGDRCYLVSPETAVASAITGRLTDPRTLKLAYPIWKQPHQFRVNNDMLIPPRSAGDMEDIIRKETIGTPPVSGAYPDNIKGVILIKLGDKVTTDHIMPAGEYLKYRSNIPVYAKYVFACFNREGEPSFALRSIAVKNQGMAGIIVAGESYGQGSSREHAAICPMYLGIRAVLALGFERIHTANMVNFGIVPIIFNERASYEALSQGDIVEIHDIWKQLANGPTIDVIACRSNGGEMNFSGHHSLSPEDIAIIKVGGRLNFRNDYQ